MATKKIAEKSKSSPELLMLGYLCVKDLETLPEMVDVLDRFGFSGPDIAKICNAAEGSIRNARLGMKDKKRTKNAKRPVE